MRYLAALSSGLALFAADHPLHWWWLQFVALLPFFWAVANARRSRRRLWPIGLIAAAANVLPLLLFVGQAPPLLATAALILLQWPLTTMLAGRLLLRGPLAGPLAAAAVLTLAELLVWHTVPIFGTAQCFVRPLSAAPMAIAFIAFTGIGGLVFALAATQALLVRAVLDRQAAPLLAALAVIAVAAGLDLARSHAAGSARLQVVVHGWADFPGSAADAMPLYEEAFRYAAAAHAQLLVTPEAAAVVGIDGGWLGSRAQAADRLAAAAKTSGVAAAIGVFLSPTQDNRIWWLSPQQGLVGEYRKTHLIPWLEDYVAGDGTLVTTAIDGITVGGMICHDDNFTDVARAYGRSGVQLLAVPTNDWPAIREYHLESGIFRAIENGYAIARAASNGISALIDCRGHVTARIDHVSTDGHAAMQGDLLVGDGVPTWYARLGDWPIAGLCGLVLAIALRRRPHR